MNIKILITAMLSFLTLQASAQQEAQADELLRKLAQNNQAYQTIQADFTFHYQSLQSDQKSSWKGKIMMKGKKYRLNLRSSTIYYNGKTLWNHLHDAGEVNISEPVGQENTDILNHPHQIFEIHQMDLKHRYLGNDRQGNQQVHKIELYPKDLDQDYSRIRLVLSDEPVQIQSAKIFAKDGSRYTIEIENLVTDQPVPDSTFVFDKKEHPDVQIIDMRF
jgi:outer membrane lipoprotein-sorting protein